jgi:iron complex transport system permease protein
MKENQLLHNYSRYTGKKVAFILFTALFILLASVVSLLLGPSNIGLKELLDIFSGKTSGMDAHIIINLRLPRILAALLSGIALSVAGASMQSILRNPLGSPFTLGISNAAAFGAAFALILFGAGSMQSGSSDSVIISNPYIITISAFLWSLVACFLILLVARMRGATPENMILAGIIASSLFAAMTTGLQYVADDIELSAMVFWTFGDLSKGGWHELLILTIILIPVLIYFLRNSWNFNALGSGDESAQSIGVNIFKLRTNTMIIASLATASVVSLYGIIAFVGLVVPHIVRRLIGSDERFLMPASALLGGAFLIVCDMLARTVISPLVLPVGIITSIVGAPLFIFILVKGIGSSQWK